MEWMSRNINAVITTSIMHTSTSSTMVDEVTNLISNQCKNVEGNIKSYLDEKINGLNCELVNTLHSDTNVPVFSTGFMYTWGGKNHSVPEGFVLFPKDS